MMPLLSLILPFFRNSGMLAHQYGVWAGYSDELKAQIEILIVEDGESTSSERAVSVPRPDGLPALRIFRLLPTKRDTSPPWRQHACRNRGAHEALGSWLLPTDMDHVLPARSLRALLDILPTADPSSVFTFHRLDAPLLRPTKSDGGRIKPHCNTFALTKAHYWAIGGYDEDCVGYGTDSHFRRRLYDDRAAIHLEKVPIVRFPREVIPDASTSIPGFEPRQLRAQGRRRSETTLRLAEKARAGLGPTVLEYAWEREL
jgi:hypothetical protein